MPYLHVESNIHKTTFLYLSYNVIKVSESVISVLKVKYTKLTQYLC